MRGCVGAKNGGGGLIWGLVGDGGTLRYEGRERARTNLGSGDGCWKSRWP